MRLSALALLLFPLPLMASEPVTLTGRVLIQNAGPRTVLAFIETGDTGVTHVLRLSSEEPFPQNPSPGNSSTRTPSSGPTAS